MNAMKLPPFPSLPAPLQTARFFKDPFSLTKECRRKLGDLFTLRLLGLGNWVFVSQPDHIREVFKAPPDVLVSGEINASTLGFMLGLDATFCLDGDAHLKRRKLMHPFFNGRAVLEKVDLMREVTLAELEKFPAAGPFPFQPWSLHSSLVVVMTLLFGASKPADLEELTEVFENFAHKGLRSPLLMMPFLQLNLGRFSPWGRILGLRKKTFEVFDRAIAERRERPEEFAGRDVAAQVCAWRNEAGEMLSAESIRDEILNDIFAGHETTGNTLSWCLECALTHPPVLEKLRAELDGVLAGEPIRAEHLKSLPYLLAFLEECFRCRPLAPTEGIRMVKQPFQLGEFLLPPGTIVVHSSPLFAERPEIFEDPDTFEPERFVDRKMKPFTWNPFGGGRRMCLGKGLAEVELAVTVAILFSRYDIKLAQAKVEMERAGFFFAPSQGLLIEVTPRPAQG
jgi:cytochrome P450